MSIGSDLRQAREQQGLTLRDISDRTKIRGPVLRAMEQDQFDPTIGVVIMRGFVKLYAREVGLDPSEMAERFNELTTAGATDATDRDRRATTASDTPRPAATWLAATVVLLVLAAGYLGWQWTSGQRADQEPAVQQAAAPAPPATGGPKADRAADAPAPAAPAVAPPAASPPASPPVPPPASPPVPPPEPGVLRVELEAADASWLAATADGRQVAYRTLNAGEKVSVDIRDEAVLRIGVPGNVSVRINGRAIRPLPRPATPATLRITPDTYRDLLVP